MKLNLRLKLIKELKTLLNRVKPSLKVERIRVGLPLEESLLKRMLTFFFRWL